jgi:hypothetical protein
MICRSRVKTIPREALCMMASISRSVLRKTAPARAPRGFRPEGFEMAPSESFFGGRPAMANITIS